MITGVTAFHYMMRREESAGDIYSNKSLNIPLRPPCSRLDTPDTDYCPDYSKQYQYRQERVDMARTQVRSRTRNRNSNMLSAILCLVKEIDIPSLEVVEMAVRCRIEEMDD